MFRDETSIAFKAFTSDGVYFSPLFSWIPLNEIGASYLVILNYYYCLSWRHRFVIFPVC